MAQILYSGLGGHGAVAFGIVAGDIEDRWRNVFGFVGIEQLLPAYRDKAQQAVIEHGYVRAIPGRPWRSWGPLSHWLDRTSPSTVLLHSPTLLWPCWHYCRARKVPLIVVEHQANHLKTPYEWLSSHAMMYLADAIVFLTAEYRAEMHARMGRAFRPEKVSVIANGIDLSAFAGAAPLQHGRPIRLGMVGRFTSTKLFPLLIEAAERLRELQPSLDFTLSFAGSGERLEATRARVAASAIRDRVVFEGMIFNEDLSRWYRGLDIYCHISAGETLPISIIQAMAAGLPVIGSRVPGIEPLLGGGRGVLIDNDPDAIAAAVIGLVSAPAGARALGAAARATAEREFSQRATFKNYDALLRRMLSSSSERTED